MQLSEFKPWFDEKLVLFLDKKISECEVFLSDAFLIENIKQARILAVNGGKRIRPYLASVLFEAVGGSDMEDVTHYFIGIELFHIFCLIHDDVIDRGDCRHSEQTIHEFSKKSLESQGRRGDLVHLGNSQAILVGDLLFQWASECFYGQDASADVRQHLATMIQEVILGQMIDVDIASRATVSSELLDRKNLLKTARYSFVRPMQLGVFLGGGLQSDLSFCEEFGTALGKAFQVQDDLLDIISSTGQLQKNIFADVRSGQHTFFTQYIFDHGSENDRSVLNACFGRECGEQELKQLADVFETSGAIKYGRKMIDDYFVVTQNILAQSNYLEEIKDILQTIIHYLANRSH